MPNRYEVTYEIGEARKEERTVLWRVGSTKAVEVATYPTHLSLDEALQQHDVLEAQEAGIALLRSLRDKIEANTWGLNRLEKLILQTLIGEKLTNSGEL